MNKKGNMMMTVFISLLIGLIALTIILPIITDKITDRTVTNDQFTASNTTCVTLSNDLLCLSSITSTVNASNGVDIQVANWTICSATRQSDGLLLSGDAETKARFNAELINATYVSRDCQPITGTTGTVIGYVPLLFAVILLIFVAVQIK